jgi:DNA-binding PadR family transcriptional regulator
MTELATVEPNPVASEEQKQTLVGLWLLKKLDLSPEDGGMEFPVVLPPDLSPLDEYLQTLAVQGYVEINRKKERYELTKQGIAYIGEVIDEAEAMVRELDELETHDAITELRASNYDLMRARFLWGWYEGEFDDLILFQERRGIDPVERMWAFYLTSDDFFREIAKDLS